MTTPANATLLRQRLQGITDQRTIMRIIAHQILERHHQASAREIAAPPGAGACGFPGSTARR